MVRQKIICSHTFSNEEVEQAIKLICADSFDPRVTNFKEGDIYYTSLFHQDNPDYYLIAIPGTSDRRVPKKFFLTEEEYRMRTINRIINE